MGSSIELVIVYGKPFHDLVVATGKAHFTVVEQHVSGTTCDFVLMEER